VSYFSGEAVSEGVSDLENTLKETKAKLDVQLDKFRYIHYHINY
jgi:hypothetical protein